MNDQAKRLRDIIKKKDVVVDGNFQSYNGPRHEPRIIAVASGKGGVGKSNFTINLGLELINLGYRVTIIDADIGLANVDVILGVIPKYTLADVINGRKTLREAMVKGPKGINLISGGSGLKELIDLTERELSPLVRDLDEVGQISDYILIDTGAGINSTVLSFVRAAEQTIVVTTPEPTSITDAYALIKNIAVDNLNDIRLLINRVESENEAQEVFNKLNITSQRFLNTKLKKLGFLYDDNMVTKSVKMQKPFTLSYPDSTVSKGIKVIASSIVDKKEKDSYKAGGFKKFINRLVSGYKKDFINR
ncbi:MAG: MinD/ParA family protein [Anaeromicrobium sp.]|jgi:flagellar biosynthesis protein FlhG|uniref:MinD/ParA family protein n=1 Tax=Anaeromicrobium sp. TaxID=1929132 RepID=UPI0025D4E092|nr:MinD/ParA family protein [Anaeromicrobium sp.]MCT4595600.1 MinD/ParA family protein [Anaeromicrobium sp.]